MKRSRTTTTLLLVSVAFVASYYGFSVPNLGAQATGTVIISVGSSTMSSSSSNATVTFSSTADSSTTTTRQTSIIDGGGDGGGGVPEFQVGPLVFAFAIGLALVICCKQRN